LQLGTLIPMNIEVPTKYPLRQDRIVVFEIRLHNKSPMLYRPALHGNWNALSLARRALKDKFPTPMVPRTTVLQNCQLFLLDPVYTSLSSPPACLHGMLWGQLCLYVSNGNIQSPWCWYELIVKICMTGVGRH
jgi:hypothetical protein